MVSDVPPGSTVAVLCDTQLATAPGYRTPFWLGDVVEAVGDAAGGNLDKVIIHFRMPQAAGGLFCDDATKPWNLACHAQHTYSKIIARAVSGAGHAWQLLVRLVRPQPISHTHASQLRYSRPNSNSILPTP